MKLRRKYAAFTLLVIDDWLLDHPDEPMRRMLVELLERRCDNRIVHNTLWIDTGALKCASTPPRISYPTLAGPVAPSRP